jgi:uncharacterized protein (DUF58 family)
VGVPFQYNVAVLNLSAKPQTGLQLRELIVNPYPSLQDFIRLSTPAPKQPKRPLTQPPRRVYSSWFRYVAQQRKGITQAIALPTLPPQRSTEVTVEVMPLQRGLLHLKGFSLTCPDPLGLVNTCRTVPLPETVLILPKRYPLPPINLPGLRRYQSGGVALSSAVGETEEFRSLREYQPGDAPRNIHWKSWAKVGKPIVKEAQDEYFVRHALVLDTFIDEGSGESDAERLEAAVSIAASFASQVQSQDALLDLLFVGLDSHCFTVGRSLGQTERMLEILAAVQPCPAQSFAELIPAVLQRLPQMSSCICIFLRWDATRQTLVQRLRQQQVPVLVLLLQGDDLPAELAAHIRVLHLDNLQAELLAL